MMDEKDEEYEGISDCGCFYCNAMMAIGRDIEPTEDEME